MRTPTLDNRPVVLNGPEILAADFKPPARILGGWICEGHLAMVFGKTGIGKSWLSYSAALAIARGEDLLGWEVPEPRRVLYIDAEIDPAEIADRLDKLAGGDVPENFLLCSGLRLKDGIPPIDDEEGQEWYEDLIDEHGADVVFIDNLCSILVNQSIVDDQAWLPVQPMLNRLRAKRIAVVIVHHAGKGGDYLGTSRMTQNLNAVVRLERPQDYDPREGAVLNVSFDKGRSLYGDDASGYRLRLQENESGRLVWSENEATSSEARLVRLAEHVRSRTFRSQRELGEALNLVQSAVSTEIKKAERAGYLERGEAARIFKEVRGTRKEDSNTPSSWSMRCDEFEDDDDEDF